MGHNFQLTIYPLLFWPTYPRTNQQAWVSRATETIIPFIFQFLDNSLQSRSLLLVNSHDIMEGNSPWLQRMCPDSTISMAKHLWRRKQNWLTWILSCSVLVLTQVLTLLFMWNPRNISGDMPWCDVGLNAEQNLISLDLSMHNILLGFGNHPFS